MDNKRALIDMCMPLVATAALAMMLLVGCKFDPSGLAGPPVDADPNADAPVDAPPLPDADPNADAPVDALLPDAPVDAPPGDPCLAWIPKPAHFDPCVIVDPTGGLALNLPGEYTYNTDTGTLTPPGGGAPIAHAREVLTAPDPDVRLVSVDSFSIGTNSSLRVTGGIPLVIASWSTLTVDGTIDVSSSIANGDGAGANTGTCNAAAPGMQADAGGGGGGGGGFGDDGGDGGDGGAGAGAGGSKGSALGSAPANVRGGCPGEKGAGGDRGDGGGAGGAGGGALQLTAQVSITVNGKLNAGGAGGRGADGDSGGNDTRRSGGGGSGSGGMLGLEAPLIAISNNAILAANGGGGGGGCNGSQAGDGDDGQLDDAVANGGPEEGDSGPGGDGGFVTTTPGQPGVNGTRGGGGGGGGVGYIIMSTTPAITGIPKISPDYVTP